MGEIINSNDEKYGIIEAFGDAYLFWEFDEAFGALGF